MSGTIRNGPGSEYEVGRTFSNLCQEYFRSLVSVSKESGHMLVTSPNVWQSSSNFIFEHIYIMVYTFMVAHFVDLYSWWRNNTRFYTSCISWRPKRLLLPMPENIFRYSAPSTLGKRLRKRNHKVPLTSNNSLWAITLILIRRLSNRVKISSKSYLSFGKLWSADKLAFIK